MNDIVFAGEHGLTFTVSMHRHRSWELVYCTGAQGRFVFDGFELPYAEGDVVIIPPELSHENLSDSGFTNIYLYLENSTLSFSRPAIVHDDGNHSVLHLFADALYFFRSGENRSSLLSAYGDLIVRHLALSPAIRQGSRLTEEIKQSILLSYSNPSYALDAFLHAMPYSYDYLCKRFRQECGTTPHKYLTQLRLQAAADLLRNLKGDVSLTEVAHLCGFRDPLYFSRVFKSRYGLAPSAWLSQERCIAASGVTPPDA